MTVGRKEVEFDEAGDAAKLQAYKDTIARVSQRQGEGGVPVGGAPQLSGTPNMAQVQDAGNLGQQLPEQERPYSPEEFQAHQRAGKTVGGIGAAYPANQRQSLGSAPTPGVLSDESVAGLEAMSKAQEEAQAAAQPPTEDEDTEGTVPGGPKKLPSGLDSEYMQLLMGQQVDQLQRRERREAIEKRCKPVDLRHIVIGSGAEQTVPIVPDLFEPRYRTLSGHEDAFAKRFAWEMCHGDDISQMYYDTIMGLTNVVLATLSISGDDLPDHRTESGGVDQDVFAAKFEDVMKRPFIVLFDLWTNYNWFLERIRTDLDTRSLGNG